VTGADDIRGERTSLRPLTEHDLQSLVGWRNKHRLCFTDSSPLTPKGQVAWYAAYRHRNDDLMYVIQTPDGRSVGCVGLYHVDRSAATAEFGRLMIGRDEDKGHGYATDACRALLEHARTVLGLDLVYLQVIAGNQRAIALYMSLGFVRDPSRDASIERDGTQVELVGMSLALSPAAAPVPPPIGVVVVCPGITPSTHIRLLSPLKWLEERGQVTLAMIPEHRLQPSRRELVSSVLRGRSPHRETRLAAESVVRAADIVILQRSTSPAGMRTLALARRSGAGVVYECDDNFLVIGRDTPAVGAYYTAPAVRRRFVKLLGHVDVVTVSTRVLASAFGEFAADVRILPTSTLTRAPKLRRQSSSGTQEPSHMAPTSNALFPRYAA
jgi:RimJ/RimL family protein N-acetyltransferase